MLGAQGQEYIIALMQSTLLSQLSIAYGNNKNSDNNIFANRITTKNIDF